MNAVATEIPSLAVRDLSVSIGGSRILRGVSLDIRPKTVFCLMGRNGVGKTTTLKAITGLMPSDTGSVKLDGGELSRMSPEKPSASRGSVNPHFAFRSINSCVFSVDR